MLPSTPPAGYSEEQAIEQLSGSVDVYVSKFRPMRHTLSGREERTLMKLLVHVESGRVVGCHMWVAAAAVRPAAVCL